MTEQNDLPDAGAQLQEAEWPDGTVLTGDKSVDTVLQRLDIVPETSLGEHSTLYSSMHDALLNALNAESGSAVHAVASASGQITAESGGA